MNIKTDLYEKLADMTQYELFFYLVEYRIKIIEQLRFFKKCVNIYLHIPTAIFLIYKS